MTLLYGIFGNPAAGAQHPCALQFSPLIPHSTALEDQPPQSLDALTIAAPPNTVERRYTLARALEALKTGGELTVLAPKDKGGQRLKKELESFGCTVTQTAKAHHRICTARRPAQLLALDDALQEGKPRLVPGLGMWSQPGIFAWDRLDAGSRLLMGHLPPLSGTGADFGCGIGHLSQHILRSTAVTTLHAIDIDRRAVDAARRNITDPRILFHWADTRQSTFNNLDFIAMNPPFHENGQENRALGLSFITRAAEALNPKGTLWLTANRHLPYEDTLKKLFRQAMTHAQQDGYKIIEARK